MKKRKLFSIFGVASLLLAGTFLHHGLESINAAGNGVDDSKEKWSAIGTINGSNWDKDFPLSYDATDDRYELEIALTAGNEFKVRLNNAWTTSIGYGNGIANGSTYLSNSGGNCKVKTTGNYVLWVKDDNVKNYGDKSYGMGIEKAATVEYCTVTHYKKDGTQLNTEQVLKNSTYNPAFEEEEGYKLEGWYSDQALTKKVEKGSKITTNINLYPKYIEAKDYVIYFSDENATFGSAPTVYMWAEALDGHTNESWPGAVMEKDTQGRYYVEIDASKSYDKVIFTNGSSEAKQTTNLDLNAYNEDTYVLGTTTDTQGHYNATLKRTGITNLITKYYNEGTYTRNTTINLNTEALDDISTHFHGSVVLERTTYFTPEALWMTRGENSTTYSYYGTSGENMTTGSATEVGIAPEKLGTVTKDHKDWDPNGKDENGMEGFYITLKDIMEKASTVEWTYSNGVYSTTGLTEEFLAFTAPCLLDTQNYVQYTGVEVEEVGETLVLRLLASETNSGALSVETNVLSQATITK